MDMFQQISNEAGYDVIEARNDEIIPVGDLDGPRGEKGDPGVGFDVTPEGNFNLNKKRVIGLKTPDDVAIDDSIENYSRDLETAVNKRYLNQFFLKKNRNETVFDCAGLSLQNTEVYYPSLYNDRSVPNVGYVSVEDNKVRTEIDTKLATKADKSYADNTYLTKKSGGVLAQSLQNKADKSYVDNTFLKKVVGRVLTQKILSKLDIHGSNMMEANLDMGGYNITHLKNPTNDTDAVNKKYMLDYVDSSHITSVGQENTFAHIMTDSINQLSEEDDIELGSLIDHPNSYHKINTKVVDSKLVLDSNKGYYSSRLGGNSGIKDYCLRAHNAKRALHQSTPPLNWDVRLAQHAQAWADHLARTGKFDHAQGTGEGENLYMSWGSGSSDAESCSSATGSWYDEIKYYNYNNPGFSMKTGHFTQVVWRSTTKLGCGVKSNNGKTYVVARYYPPGNYNNQYRQNVMWRK
ncbi:hypothetical protein ACROYT_G009921 [Oculina patagonica]